MPWFSEFSIIEQGTFIYLLLVNIFTFILFGIDKSSSIAKRRRTPEKTLLILMLMGGSVGGLAGINFFLHKTKKFHFFLVGILSLLTHLFLLSQLFELPSFIFDLKSFI